MERTHEEATEALRAGREGRHPEAPFAGEGAGRFIGWLDITASKFYDWPERYGKVNEHNGWVPRDLWLEDWEKQAIIGFHLKNPLEGYLRLTFMMIDATSWP